MQYSRSRENSADENNSSLGTLSDISSFDLNCFSNSLENIDMWRHSVSEDQPVDKDVFDGPFDRISVSASGPAVDPESAKYHGHQIFFPGQVGPFLQPGMSPLMRNHGSGSHAKSNGSGPSLTEAGSSCGVDSMSSPGAFSPVVNPAMVTSSHSLPPLETPGFACAPDDMPRTTNQAQGGMNAITSSGYSTAASHLPGCPHAHGMYVNPWNQSTKGYYESHSSSRPMFPQVPFPTMHHPGTYASNFQSGPTTDGPANFVSSTTVAAPGNVEPSDFVTQNPVEYGIDTPASTSSNIHEDFLDGAKQTGKETRGTQNDPEDIVAVSSPSSEKYDPASFPEPELSQGRKSEIYNAKSQSDGLYHCYFEKTENCGHEPVKLKCNYDKYIDSHLKPWRCKVPGCEELRFSSTACRLRHEREAHGAHGHGMNPYLCLFPGCERAQPDNGFPRSWNCNDHMKRCHNYKTEEVASPSPMEAGKNVLSASKQAPRKKASRRDSKKSVSGSTGRGKSQSDHSRKNAQPSGPGSAGVTKTNKLRSDWHEHRARLQQYLERLENPIDFLENHKQLREDMEAMSGISRELCTHD